MSVWAEYGRHGRNVKGGLHRAAYWRALGFPNLVKARAAKARYRRERLQLEEARQRSPYAEEFVKWEMAEERRRSFRRF